MSSRTCPFPKLRDDVKYEPCTFPMQPSTADPAYFPTFLEWLEIFRKSTPTFKETAEKDPSVNKAKAKSQDFDKRFRRICNDLEKAYIAGKVPKGTSVLTLCVERDTLLRTLGFQDCFKDIKMRENASALLLLTPLLKEIDAVAPDCRIEVLLRGIFAGNIFDLGAAASAQLFKDGQASFSVTRQKLPHRPWLIDDMENFQHQWDKFTWKKLLIFVDNAGADVVLGILPFAREALRRGADVVLAANEVPSINDITAPELTALLQSCTDGVLARALASGTLRVVSSGNAMPVIDLRSVSFEVADEAVDADLVVLEGMGRAIETNLNAEFTCDVLKVGMVKHPEVAQALRGKLYDVVCKYTPGPSKKEMRSQGCSLWDPTTWFNCSL